MNSSDMEDESDMEGENEYVNNCHDTSKKDILA